MNIRQLQYAVTLAETLHFGKSAEAMFTAQSAFSTQIAKLEREVGVKLFDRASNRVELTAAGEAFIDKARLILTSVESAIGEAQDIDREPQVLRLGLFAEAAAELTPIIMSAFRRAAPWITVTVEELTIANQFEVLTKGDVDVAFLRPPTLDDRVQMHTLFYEPRFVGVPHGHPLAEAEVLTLDDVADERFVRYPTATPTEWKDFWSLAEVAPRASREMVVKTAYESLAAIAYSGFLDSVPASATRWATQQGINYIRLEEAEQPSLAVAHRRGDDSVGVQTFRSVALTAAKESLFFVPLATLPDTTPSN